MIALVMITVAPSEFVLVYTIAGTCDVWSTVLPAALVDVMTVVSNAVAAYVEKVSVDTMLPLLSVVVIGNVMTAAGTVRTT